MRTPGTGGQSRPNTRDAHAEGQSRRGGRDARADGHAREKPKPSQAPRTGPPLVGPWLFATREGAEGDLVCEIDLALGRAAASVVAPGLVRARAAPTHDAGSINLAFARGGWRLLGSHAFDAAAESGDAQATPLLDALLERLLPRLAGAPRFALDAFVPDTTRDNPLGARALELGAALGRALAARAPELAARLVPLHELRALRDEGVGVAALCVRADGIELGWVDAAEALSLAPGARFRVHVSGDKPSRAARKLEEAFAWFGVAPGAGELCVDLGAAPGGWSWVLLERGARVVAVDPARLRPDIARHRNLRHVMDSAFRYEHLRDDPFGSGEPADWLFCDMAWRPLEVAALLAKWARNRGARLLIANLKLPMIRKAEMLVRLRAVVCEGGWRDVRVRQLYHDRQEVTLAAHR